MVILFLEYLQHFWNRLQLPSDAGGPSHCMTDKVTFLFYPKREKRVQKFGFFDFCVKLVNWNFVRNYLKCRVLWLANFLHKSHILENCHSRDLGLKALDQSDLSISQITTLLKLLQFWNFWPFFVFFCINVKYYNTFEMMQAFFGKIGKRA